MRLPSELGLDARSASRWLSAIGYAAKRLQPRYNRPQRPSLAFADFDLCAGGIIHD